MPMIDTDLIKPASDAVQKAFREWHEAGQAYADALKDQLQDPEAVNRTYQTMSLTGKVYEEAKFALSHTVYTVIGKAVREAAVEDKARV